MKNQIKELISQKFNQIEQNQSSRNRFFSLQSQRGSPSRSKSSKISKNIFNDRLLPGRVSANLFNIMNETSTDKISQNKNQQNNRDINELLRQQSSFDKYSNLLRMNIIQEEQNKNECCSYLNDEGPYTQQRLNSRDKGGNVLLYQSKRYRPYVYSNHLEPLLLQTENTNPIRRIPKLPYKILDAPRLKDDFYNSLLDWSNGNQIAIGLLNSVHTYNAMTNRSQELTELDVPAQVSSLSWCRRSELLAVGDDCGFVKIFDVEKKKEIRKYQNHGQRVGTLDWNGYLITSGSRDSNIFVSDTRVQRSSIMQFSGHRQEVCGLKWSPSEDLIASGGNDNRVLVYSIKMPEQSQCVFKDHLAAVKALAWSPHQSNLLASGGGTTDKSLKLWNVSQNCLVQSIDTGSQICNMRWSVNTDELVLTHGFSQNLITLWQVNQISLGKQIATLSGHEYRVLYLAMSPDGESIVTGSGDETLRFWKIFPQRKKTSQSLITSSLDSNKIEVR